MLCSEWNWSSKPVVRLVCAGIMVCHENRIQRECEVDSPETEQLSSNVISV